MKLSVKQVILLLTDMTPFKCKWFIKILIDRCKVTDFLSFPVKHEGNKCEWGLGAWGAVKKSEDEMLDS